MDEGGLCYDGKVDLAGLLAAAYDVPLAQAHATPASISALLKREDGKLVVRDDFSDEADRAFQLAHTLLLHALNLQVQHFSDPGLENAVERAAHDYVGVWGRSPEPAA